MSEEIIVDRQGTLQEKIEIWTEAEAKAIARYGDILEVMTGMAENIDGNPAMSVKLLEQVKGDLNRLEQRLAAFCGDVQEKQGDRWVVLKTVGLILSWVVSSGVGVLVGYSLIK